MKSIFCLKENIVASTLDARMPKNKAEYEAFKYHNNQRRKELDWIKIEAFFKKVKQSRAWIRRIR